MTWQRRRTKLTHTKAEQWNAERIITNTWEYGEKKSKWVLARYSKIFKFLKIKKTLNFIYSNTVTSPNLNETHVFLDQSCPRTYLVRVPNQEKKIWYVFGTYHMSTQEVPVPDTTPFLEYSCFRVFNVPFKSWYSYLFFLFYSYK